MEIGGPDDSSDEEDAIAIECVEFGEFIARSVSYETVCCLRRRR